jgi:hypothetical protein
MGVLESTARIVQMGGAPQHSARVASLRAAFEARTGAFAPDDPWFEERSRAFWCDAVTRGRFGRAALPELDAADQAWVDPLERSHRGLFRAAPASHRRLRPRLVDVWSGAEFVLTALEDESLAELDAGAEQLMDARLVGGGDPPTLALLPGAIFHPSHATSAIDSVLEAARASDLPTHDVLDALLRMERTLRALSRVKAAYAYRPEALTARPTPTSPARASARR